MKSIVSITFCLFSTIVLKAQHTAVDSIPVGKLTVIKDPRIDILSNKLTEFNILATRLAKGYRLLVLKSNDKNYTMQVRAHLLQNFPDQKVYMTFQAPFIKLKFGDFIEKSDAEKYRDMIIKGKFVTNNIYVIPEIVEIKPDKIDELN